MTSSLAFKIQREVDLDSIWTKRSISLRGRKVQLNSPTRSTHPPQVWPHTATAAPAGTLHVIQVTVPQLSVMLAGTTASSWGESNSQTAASPSYTTGSMTDIMPLHQPSQIKHVFLISIRRRRHTSFSTPGTYRATLSLSGVENSYHSF